MPWMRPVPTAKDFPGPIGGSLVAAHGQHDNALAVEIERLRRNRVKWIRTYPGPTRQSSSNRRGEIAKNLTGVR